MKYLLAISSLFFVFSCGSVKDAIKDLLTFEINEGIGPETIPGSTVTCSIPMVLPEELGGNLFKSPITINKEDNFPNEGTNIGLIKTAKLTKFSLSVDSSSKEKNFDWMDSLILYAESANHPKVQIAAIEDIQDNLTTISLATTGTNIADYIKEDSGFEIVSEVSGCPPGQEFVFNGAFTLEVSAVGE